jgi:hypothetical protein
LKTSFERKVEEAEASQQDDTAPSCSNFVICTGKKSLQSPMTPGFTPLDFIFWDYKRSESYEALNVHVLLKVYKIRTNCLSFATKLPVINILINSDTY